MMLFRNPHIEENLLDCAVMIVGAGPAGISTWLHLQKEAPQLAGRSIVIEKATFPRDKLCAGGLCNWGMEVLEALGVELDISSLTISDLEFRFGEEAYPLHQPHCLRIVQRIDFDHALVKAALIRGLDLRENEMLTEVLPAQNKLIAITNRGKYAVQALVGADGAFSVVRKKMLPSRKRHLAPTLQIIAPAGSRYDAEFDEKKMVVDLTVINKGLQGYVWHVPCLRNEAPSIAHGIADFRVCPDRPRADMKKLFSRELKRRNIHQGPETWGSHPIPWHLDDAPLAQPNMILVGDAAGVEPAFGGGIYPSLLYGEVAAQAIIDASQKDDFSFSDYQERIQSHSVGRFIAKCTHLATAMYGGKMNPLDAAREVFSTRPAPSDIMHQLLSRHLELHPQSSSVRK